MGPRGLDFSPVDQYLSQRLSEHRREEEELKRKQEAERRRLENNEDAVATANILSDSDIALVQKQAEEMNGDPAGSTDRLLKWFDGNKKAAIEQAPERVRARLEVAFAEKRAALNRASFENEVKQRQLGVIRDQEQGIAAEARALLGANGQFLEMLARRKASVDALDIPEETRARLNAKARETLVMAAATGYAQQNPRETLEAFGQALPGPRYDATTRKAVMDAIAAGKAGPGVVPGMIEAGNIDVMNRPRVKNADGSTSTVLTVGVNIDGREVLLPLVSDDGRVVSEAEAIQTYRKTGRHLGKFHTKGDAENSVSSAEVYAQTLHDQQAGLIGEKGQHPALSMLPFDRVDDITRIARTTIERNVSSLRVGLSDKAKDVQAAVMSGVPVSREDVAGVAEQYATAYGPVEGARRYQDEIAVPLAVGEGIGRLKTASPQERAALIAGSKPKGVDGAAEQKVIHDALLQANAIVEKQLREDPATYVSSSPRVATALQALDSAPPESRAAAVAVYANATIAEQERLGAPTPRLLTGAQSDAIVKAFNDNPPERASDVIAGLEMEWGKHWPMVYKQLAQENKLTPAAIVIPNMKDQGSRARMASASALKLEDLKGLVPSGDAKDVRDKLQGYFEPAAKTLFTQSVGGMSTATTIMDQAEKLALVYRTQGKSVNDSAKQAYDEVIGWKYEFADTYRVPREQQPEMVTRGAAAALRDLGRVAMFDSPYPMGANNRARQSLDAIKANGYWVTNDDETGVILKVRGRDNSEYTAYREDGARIEYKWQDLRRIAGDDVAGEQRMIESGRATEMNQAKKRQQAEEEARQQRLRDMGLR